VHSNYSLNPQPPPALSALLLKPRRRVCPCPAWPAFCGGRRLGAGYAFLGRTLLGLAQTYGPAPHRHADPRPIGKLTVLALVVLGRLAGQRPLNRTFSGSVFLFNKMFDAATGVYTESSGDCSASCILVLRL